MQALSPGSVAGQLVGGEVAGDDKRARSNGWGAGVADYDGLCGGGGAGDDEVVGLEKK
jgi:hypothetical protein